MKIKHGTIISQARSGLDKLSQLGFLADLTGRKPSTGKSITVFDGLRGLAALIVLADHSRLIEVGRGGNGVWLFFALSGYLLTLPVVYKADFWSIKNIILFFSRRLGRILPMYWFTILLFFLFFTGYSGTWFWNHFTFNQADMHLWSVKQELLFYLLLPLIIFPIQLFIKIDWLKCFLLYLAAILSGLFLTRDVFSLTGMIGNTRIPFQLAPFLAGMGAVYLAKILPKKETTTLGFKATMSAIVVLLVTLTVFHNFNYTVGAASVGVWHLGVIFSLLLVAVQYPALPPMERLLNFLPFRAIGIVGYSFYLLHWPVILTLRDIYGKNHFEPVEMFFLAGAITYVLSSLSYIFIEKPGIKYAPWFAKKILDKFNQPS